MSAHVLPCLSIVLRHGNGRARKHRSLCTKLLGHLVPTVVTRGVFRTAAEVPNVTPPCQLLSRITTHDLFSLIRIFFISALHVLPSTTAVDETRAIRHTRCRRIINNGLLISSTRNRARTFCFFLSFFFQCENRPRHRETYVSRDSECRTTNASQPCINLSKDRS